MREDPQERFDQAFSAWARRAPRTAPGQAAADLAGRLPERGVSLTLSRKQRRLAAAAAALVLAVAAGWAALRLSLPRTGEVPIPPLDENVVLLWIDPQTPLYLTVAAPATSGGTR